MHAPTLTLRADERAGVAARTTRRAVHAHAAQMRARRACKRTQSVPAQFLIALDFERLCSLFHACCDVTKSARRGVLFSLAAAIASGSHLARIWLASGSILNRVWLRTR